MKTSELIEKLQASQKEYGDLDVAVRADSVLIYETEEASVQVLYRGRFRELSDEDWKEDGDTPVHTFLIG